MAAVRSATMPAQTRLDPVRDAGIGQDLRMAFGQRDIDQHAGLLPRAGEAAAEELARGRLVGPRPLDEARHQGDSAASARTGRDSEHERHASCTRRMRDGPSAVSQISGQGVASAPSRAQSSGIAR